MADRITQLQDALNQVSRFTLVAVAGGCAGKSARLKAAIIIVQRSVGGVDVPSFQIKPTSVNNHAIVVVPPTAVEAWHMDSAHTPLNYDDGNLLYLHLIKKDQFCNSVGILQQTAQPGKSFSGFDKSSGGEGGDVTQEGHAALFATLISRTAKDIDFLIESLPSEECSPALQAASLHKLESESFAAGRRLEEAVMRAEKLLELIQQALSEIAESRLSTK